MLTIFLSDRVQMQVGKIYSIVEKLDWLPHSVPKMLIVLLKKDHWITHAIEIFIPRVLIEISSEYTT